ncbi:MAG: hypothetical protein HY831_00995 [Candidatus Aenigmarchaeota archaeon]|nr:hypothetical protein [Candidatus Aenigmarchaeota archaeon]
MKKIILILVFAILLAIPGFSHQSASVNNLTIEIDTQPNEPPIAGDTSIITFDVTKADGEHPNHTDIYFNLTKDGKLIVTNYYIHSHLGTPSYAQYFESSGIYKMDILIEPSDHYEDSYKFEPFTVEFNITVNPNTSNPNSQNNLVMYGILITIVIIISLIVLLRKKIFR